MRFNRCSQKSLISRFRTQHMNALRMNRCCFLISPRQGTITVAVVELSLTAVLLFLLLVAAMNTQDIATAAASDTNEVENNWASVFGDKFSLSWAYSKNEKKMIDGQYLAKIMSMVTFGGVVLSMVHIFSCLMLLYGALYDIPHFLLPWLTTVLFTLLIVTLIIMSLLMFTHHKCMISVYILPLMLVMTEGYAWLMVFNFYQDVVAAKYRGRRISTTREEIVIETKTGIFSF